MIKHKQATCLQQSKTIDKPTFLCNSVKHIGLEYRFNLLLEVPVV